MKKYLAAASLLAVVTGPALAQQTPPAPTPTTKADPHKGHAPHATTPAPTPAPTPTPTPTPSPEPTTTAPNGAGPARPTQ